MINMGDLLWNVIYYGIYSKNYLDKNSRRKFNEKI